MHVCLYVHINIVWERSRHRNLGLLSEVKRARREMQSGKNQQQNAMSRPSRCTWHQQYSFVFRNPLPRSCHATGVLQGEFPVIPVPSSLPSILLQDGNEWQMKSNRGRSEGGEAISWAVVLSCHSVDLRWREASRAQKDLLSPSGRGKKIKQSCFVKVIKSHDSHRWERWNTFIVMSFCVAFVCAVVSAIILLANVALLLIFSSIIITSVVL